MKRAVAQERDAYAKGRMTVAIGEVEHVKSSQGSGKTKQIITNNKFDKQRADQLMGELLSDPTTFSKNGTANKLLNQFHQGYPLKNLRTLLRHQNAQVKKAGIWIASELGSNAAPLLKEALIASKHPDRYIRYFAFEIIMLATVNGNRKKFLYVVRSLEDLDTAVRANAIRLLCRAAFDRLSRLLASVP